METTMTMIEDSNGCISWECSHCLAVTKDKRGFEDKVKVCPKCGATVTEFLSLFGEDGDYL